MKYCLWWRKSLNVGDSLLKRLTVDSFYISKSNQKFKSNQIRSQIIFLKFHWVEDFLVSNKLRTTICKFLPLCRFLFTLKCFGVYHLTVKQFLFTLAKLKVDFFCKLLFTFPEFSLDKSYETLKSSLHSPSSISLLTQLSINSQDPSKSRKSKQYKRNIFSLILATFQSKVFKKSIL